MQHQPPVFPLAHRADWSGVATDRAFLSVGSSSGHGVTVGGRFAKRENYGRRARQPDAAGGRTRFGPTTRSLPLQAPCSRRHVPGDIDKPNAHPHNGVNPVDPEVEGTSFRGPARALFDFVGQNGIRPNG